MWHGMCYAKQLLYIFSVPGMFNNGNEKGYPIFRDFLNTWAPKELTSPESTI